jgi:putative peptidoglycan binding protein
MNPKDVLGAHPTGAIPRRPDPRDYQWDAKEIAQASAPFDWNTGYDVEADISAVLGNTFVLPTKNQGTSGSCGGQAFAYYAQALSAYYSKSAAERSAKYPYSQVYVGDAATGGGSSDRDLAQIGIRQGFGTEALTPSYPSYGGSPVEAFMERPQDITAPARISAASDRIASAYAFPSLDIDTIAQALAASKGIVLGIHGSNNGTWLSSEPKPPAPGDALWAHYMYFGKAFLENGVKKVWGKQSWGPQAAPDNNGWQKLDQAYFNTAGAIWSATTMLYTPKPTVLPTHTFSANLSLGETSADVSALQQFLAYEDCLNVTPTGYYGPITAQAVLRFQIKYGLASLATLDELGGNTVGPATRAKLNAMT